MAEELKSPYPGEEGLPRQDTSIKEERSLKTRMKWKPLLSPKRNPRKGGAIGKS